MPGTPVRFEGSQPILRVENMQTALGYYINKLGFKNVEWGNDEFTSISRDGACLSVLRRSRTRRSLGLDRRRRRRKNFTKNSKPRAFPSVCRQPNYPWALEMHVQDPDGNVLRLGSDPK